MSIKTIAILTGGGDCPGLNPAIKSVTEKALASGLQVLGIREGWRGLVETINPLALDLNTVRHLDRQGGTMLKSSRTNPFKITGGPEAVKKRMSALGINALVAIGGEDTLGVAAQLHEHHHVPIVGIPKTIDGDLSATEYCLGFESAVEIVTTCVDTLRSTADSHDRTFIVEVMGRHAGHLALKGGISAGADIILIPEHPFDPAHVAQLVRAKKTAQHNYSIVIVAEGAMAQGADLSVVSTTIDSFGHVRLGGIGQYLADYIEETTKLECRPVVLGHLQRGGSPAAFDRRMGHYFGIAACEAAIFGYFGTMVSLTNGQIGLKPLKDAIQQLRLVDVKKYYDTKMYRAQLAILNRE